MGRSFPFTTFAQPVQTGFSERAPPRFQLFRNGNAQPGIDGVLATKMWGKWDETSSIYQDCRSWRRRKRGCRAGDRAIDARDQMANDLQLAKIAGYAVWRR